MIPRKLGRIKERPVQVRQASLALVAASPFLKAGLYAQHHLFEYRDEVG